ncbi:hypothetical protein [Vibrio sp. ER1A]|uniref:hypothetical protein n=1 Tax=Vibrio sp. ER1A TaxID=1517681 RepID=UPI0004DCEBF1|nr:hypothetical protein [Vibrio sp. ER1A]KFA99447.1 hypothetical protein HW45_03535 [Vibrio sp. ER1A]
MIYKNINQTNGLCAFPALALTRGLSAEMLGYYILVDTNMGLDKLDDQVLESYLSELGAVEPKEVIAVLREKGLLVKPQVENEEENPEAISERLDKFKEELGEFDKKLDEVFDDQKDENRQ